MREKQFRSHGRHKQKTTSQLLNDSSVEWKKLKQRVKSHPLEANKNLIHKLCLRQDVPPDILDWVIERLGKPQLERRSGIVTQDEPMTPLEICLTQDTPFETFVKILKASMDIVKEKDNEDTHDMMIFRAWKVDFGDITLEKLRCLLEECPLHYFEEPMFDYLFEPILTGDLFFDDIKRVKLILGHMRHVWKICSTTISSPPTLSSLQKALNPNSSPTTMSSLQKALNPKKEDDFLLPHTYLLAMFRQLCPYYDRIKPSVICTMLRYFYRSDEVRDQISQVDSNGNSILHYIFLNAPFKIRVRRPKNREEQEDDDSSEYDSDISYDNYLSERTEEQRLAPWLDLVGFILEVHPTCAVLRNNQGRTPLHVCLAHGLPGVNLLLESDPKVVEIVDPITKLLPYQLAAFSYRTKNERDRFQNRLRLSHEEQDSIANFSEEEGNSIANHSNGDERNGDYSLHSRQNAFGIYIADGPNPGSAVMMHFDRQKLGANRGCQEDLHLSTTYLLLRGAPYLLNNTKQDTSILDSALLKEITLKKMTIAKLSRQHFVKTKMLEREICMLEKRFNGDRNEQR